MEVHIVTLVSNILFDDADEGECSAGESTEIIKCFSNLSKANNFIREWQPLIDSISRKEVGMVVPKSDKCEKLANGCGIELDFYADEYELRVETHEIA